MQHGTPQRVFETTARHPGRRLLRTSLNALFRGPYPLHQFADHHGGLPLRVFQTARSLHLAAKRFVEPVLHRSAPHDDPCVVPLARRTHHAARCRMSAPIPMSAPATP